MNKNWIIITVLSVALFIAVQYIVIEKWQESEQQKILTTFHDGYEHGLNDASNAIFQQTSNCHITKITVGNSTKEIVDLSCLNMTKNLP